MDCGLTHGCRPDFDFMLRLIYKYHRTSTHKVNLVPRMCLENDHWQNNFKSCVDKTFWLKKQTFCCQFVQHELDTNS